MAAEFQQEKNVLQEISKARDAIRRKHMLIKLGRIDFEKTRDQALKPIVDPLKKLVVESSSNKTTTPSSNKKKILKAFTRPNNLFNLSSSFDTNASYDPDSILELNSTVRPQTTFETAGSEAESDLDKSISNSYVALLGKTRKSHLDKIYGVRKLKNAIMIGDSPILFEKNTIQVNGENYPATFGLLELLFKLNPSANLISDADNKNYIKIVKATNAHKKHFDPNESIKNRKTAKFKNFIAPFLESDSIKGKGLLPRYKIVRKNTQMDYVYWDDPNELVDRLRLLIAEQSAGNPSHVNEIHSIIEELREGGYIY